MSINPALLTKLSYDPFRDFASMTMLVVPEGLARYMREDHERWKKVIKAANIRLD